MPPAQTENLHRTGTASCYPDDRYDAAGAFAKVFKTRYPWLICASLPNRTSRFVQESFKLAISTAYRKGKIRAASTRSTAFPASGYHAAALGTSRNAPGAFRLSAGRFPPVEFSLEISAILGYGNRPLSLRFGLPGLLLHAGSGGGRPRHAAAGRSQPSRYARFSLRQGRAVSGARILARTSALSAKTCQEPEGRFERITWDEALDIIATKLGDVSREFGPNDPAVQLRRHARDAEWSRH